jgi:hypothetical protein
MTIDIRYMHRAPEQIQRVRLVSVYPNTDTPDHSDTISEAQVVLHFKEYKPQQNIMASEIFCMTISED